MTTHFVPFDDKFQDQHMAPSSSYYEGDGLTSDTITSDSELDEVVYLLNLWDLIRKSLHTYPVMKVKG